MSYAKWEEYCDVGILLIAELTIYFTLHSSTVSVSIYSATEDRQTQGCTFREFILADAAD